MEEADQTLELVSRSDYDSQLRVFEENLLLFIEDHGLPSQGIFVAVDERVDVFRNLNKAIKEVKSNYRSTSIYISKFLAAVASGLFDAALNYLWDETILELRRRVAQYDLSYFYDNADSQSIKFRLGKLFLNDQSHLLIL